MKSNIIGGNYHLLLFGLVAILLIGYQGNAFMKALSASRWPTVDGQVTSSRLETREARGRRGRPTTKQVAVVEYTYQIDGKRFSNNRVNVTDDSLSVLKPSSTSTIEKYSNGAAVQVFYDPNDPSNSLLETTLPTTSFLWVGGAILVFGFCCFSFFAKPHPIAS